MAVPDNGQFAIEIKTGKRDAFLEKQSTQERARQRRQQIRELRDDDNWN